MRNDYSIFKKVLFIFTTIDNPFMVLFDKLGFKESFIYRTNTGIKFIARSKSTDINEAVAILSGKEYPREILNISSKKNPVIIDAGAHIGLFSLYAKHINPSAKIYAIEPLDKNINNLKKNLILNKIKDAIMLNYALSDRQGEAKLWLVSNKFDISTISLPKKNHQHDYLLVQSKTLGGVIKESSLARIDVLKMDIEGEEYKVLKKDINLITGKVERLLVEYHSDRDAKMRKKY